MKRTLLIFLSFFYVTTLLGQNGSNYRPNAPLPTITVGNDCFEAVTKGHFTSTLPFEKYDSLTKRNSYGGRFGLQGFLTIRWNETFKRWELDGTDNFDGENPQSVVYYSYVPTSPNPPDTAIGKWKLIQGRTDLECKNLTLSGFGLATTAPLPVTFVNFSASQKANSVVLNWQTERELNNKGFDVETSQNGLEFNKIGEVQADNNKHFYSFVVKNPSQGLQYYRLKQVDLDGKFGYSGVLSVNNNDKSITSIYPNPSNNHQIKSNYNSSKDQNITAKIFDLSGNLVESQVKHVNKGLNNLNFDLTNIKSGSYILKIENDKGHLFNLK